MTFIRRLDDLVHHPHLRWVPRLLTGWVCDLYDHRLGLTWSEIRRTRHGELPNYWQRYHRRQRWTPSEVTSTIPGAKVTYKLEDGP